MFAHVPMGMHVLAYTHIHTHTTVNGVSKGACFVPTLIFHRV